jgi:PmbA protein
VGAVSDALADPEARLALASEVLAAGGGASVELSLHHDPGLLLEYDPMTGTAAESIGTWTRAGVRVWEGGRCGVSGGTVNGAEGCLHLLRVARERAAGMEGQPGAAPAPPVTVPTPQAAPAGGLSGERARRLAAALADRTRALGLRPEVVLVKQFASSTVLATTAGTRIAMWVPQEQVLVRCAGATGVVIDSVAEQRVDGELDMEPMLRRLGAAAGALAEAGGEPDRRLPLVARPAVAALLAGGLGSLLRADAAGRSGLAAALGRRVFPGLLDLVDLPARPGGMNRRLFDDEGFPARCVNLIEGGRVAALLHSAETAAAFGAEPNGRAIRFQASAPPVPWPLNLGVRARADAMPASRNELVLALEASGWQAQPGMVAANVAGWVVRDGERVGHIGPLPLDVPIVRAFRCLAAVGGDPESVPLAWGCHCPSLAFRPEVLRDD